MLLQDIWTVFWRDWIVLQRRLKKFIFSRMVAPMLYMVAFGCAVAVHRNEFVNVEFLHDALEHQHAGLNKVIDLLIKIVLLIFTVYILFQSVMPFAFIKFQMLSTAMSLPMQYVYFSLVLLFGFMTIAYLCEIINIIICWNGKEGK